MGRPYTVTDALRDGVVKPIHWQPRVTDWQLHGTKLDVAFQREFGHLPEEERNKLVNEGAQLNALLYHDKRIAQIADYVAQHFTEHVQPNGFKAGLWLPRQFGRRQRRTSGHSGRRRKARPGTDGHSPGRTHGWH